MSRLEPNTEGLMWLGHECLIGTTLLLGVGAEREYKTYQIISTLTKSTCVVNVGFRLPTQVQFVFKGLWENGGIG